MHGSTISAEMPSAPEAVPMARFIHTGAYLLSLVLIFVIPMENGIFIEGFGRLSRLVGLLVAAAWLLSVAVTGQLRKPNAFCYFVGLFVLWSALSVFWSIDTERTIDRAKTFGQLGVLVLLLWDIYTTPQRVQMALQAFVLGGFAAAVGTVLNYLSSDAFYTDRFTAAGLHVDDLGVILALCIPAAWYLAIHSRSGITKRVELRTLNFLYIPMGILAIFLTGTRGAVVAAAPGFAYLGLTILQFRPILRIVIGVALLAAMLIVVPLVPASSWERIGTIGSEISNGDLNGRTTLWRMGLLAFTEQPLLGVGSGAFVWICGNSPPHVAHNSFISILVEVGLVGLTLFLSMTVVLLNAALRHPRESRTFWIILLTVLVLGASTLTWEHRKPAWLVMSLVVCSSACVARPQQTAAVSSQSSRVRRRAEATPELLARGGAL